MRSPRGMSTLPSRPAATSWERFTGTQIRVRKYLRIVFILLGLSNGVMLVLERGFGDLLSAPFLIAGTVTLALTFPPFVTRNRRAQTIMGIRRWRLLQNYAAEFDETIL